MDYALFSGGHDSLVSTHYCMTTRRTEKVLHLDTGTGLEENEQFVIDVCEQYDWPLRIEEAPVSFKEFLLEYGDGEPYGFPGPALHLITYIMLKERSLQNLAAEHEGKPHYWTGVRADETQRRMETVGDGETKEMSKWWWHSPISDWTEDDLDDYREEHDLPANPVVQNIHRSGECFCGAFAERDEELIDLQANYPDHFEWLMDLEQEVREELGEDHPRAYWANGSMSKPDVVALEKEYKHMKQVLCADCRRSLHNSAADW